jgi:hypothetical protein
LIHLVGDRFVVPTSFYHADYSATTRFLIIFGGGLRKPSNSIKDYSLVLLKENYIFDIVGIT